MELIVSSETSALKAQMPGDHPKDTLRHSNYLVNITILGHIYCTICLLWSDVTNAMQHSPWCNSSSVTQEIPHILWKVMAHHSFHKTAPVLPILRQIDPATLQQNYWISVLILFSHQCQGLPSGLYPSSFRTITPYCTSPLAPIRATWLAYLMVFLFF